MLSKTFWHLVRERGSFHNASSSLLDNTYSSPIPMGLFHPESVINTEKEMAGREPTPIQGEALPANNTGHCFPGQTVS